MGAKIFLKRLVLYCHSDLLPPIYREDTKRVLAHVVVKTLYIKKRALLRLRGG